MKSLAFKEIVSIPAVKWAMLSLFFSVALVAVLAGVALLVLTGGIL